MRAHLSAITLIALLGVAVGVLVLIVVLAVMAGFEREVKARILGFTPHLVVRSVNGGMVDAMADWDQVAEAAAGADGVTEAYAFLKDNTILDFGGFQSPVFFRAVDTQNKEQMAALENLIAKEKYGGTADMGLDEKVVVSEGTALAFGIHVGDTVQLYSTRNFQEVFRAYKLTEEPPVAETFREFFEEAKATLRSEVRMEEGSEVFGFSKLEGIFNEMKKILTERRRPGEVELIATAMSLLNEGGVTSEKAGEKVKVYPPGSVERVIATIEALGELDMEREDSRVLKDIREIVLPKDMEVIGIYKATQHVAHPDLFIPLPTGQELKGLQDGVDGLGVWTEDAYAAEKTARILADRLGPSYRVDTWMAQYSQFFELIARERIMMYFALSFIMLVSAFCISGIMFTVTLLKKQEIGVMKALGARPAQIIRVFLFQGMVIGVFGAGLGVVLGLLVIRFRDPIHWFLKKVFRFDPFPASVHGIDFIPAHVNPAEVASIAVGAFVLCSLAGLVPALFAAWKDAAKSLRNI